MRLVEGSLYGTYCMSVSWWRDEMRQVFVSFFVAMFVCVGKFSRFFGEI